MVSFSVSGRISRPVAETFEAVVNPERLSGYFTTGGADGRLESGATVFWSFADFPGRFPVQVVEVVENQRIVLRWASDEGSGEDGERQTTVTMDFEALEDGRTLVTIREEGWQDTEKGRKASYGNCEGWTQMLCCLKAYVEHGINLRQGYYT
ncbi:MAG: SRPBCC domain-containing protein [Roseibium sp.]|uniref:SRPBCC domain-containing protein n=1 Tax=Roseibium sp. TaxID=1936156 RepID=UPI001B0968A3|nr:SRPBCC domain-containing protein [Roseibium sp.]MBO6511037.1 SRPBCC domain-containing protein [Roseibium sp.]MBO6893435.1 SRPBCC domain-containing protein [Roseibium sp.]MBO6930598.1 SRPBCC domain-containing protein [Roseibium sp.]